MKKRKEYIYTSGEEIASAVSHGALAAVALLMTPFASAWAYAHGGALDVTGVGIFMVSVFLMLLASTLYHAMARETRHKDVFHILDHIFIFVAIAGTYTPIALSIISGWQGIVIVSVQWAMVLFGVLYKSLHPRPIGRVSLSIYLIMGWTIVFFFPLIWRQASTPLIALIAAGGVFYTAGAFFYALKGFRYHHLVWHLLINLAVLCHAVGIIFFLY